MTARILVVDDIEANVKLLEARLMAEYFQVLTATNGVDALEICQNGLCDLVLLDVMMPELDGFEVCSRLKSDPETMHIPVVMVTALDDADDRIKGLECGADDFLTKPVNDLALITRVKSLVRLKVVSDELRLRASCGNNVGLDQLHKDIAERMAKKEAKILVIEDRPSSSDKIVRTLDARTSVSLVSDPNEALLRISNEDFDTAVISLELSEIDALRLCAQIKSLQQMRSLPIVAIADHGADSAVIRALEIGVNDYIHRPIDANELLARVSTQIRGKFYNESLRKSVQQTVDQAVTDGLTGLYNRRFLDTQLASLFDKAKRLEKPLALLVLDIDHFKSVNDNHGHDVGDAIIRGVAGRLKNNIRNLDLCCRYGGEEFVVAMPDTDISLAHIVAERIRGEIESGAFRLANQELELPVTVSIGVSAKLPDDDNPEAVFKRADSALYEAKRRGRNQVFMLPAASMDQMQEPDEQDRLHSLPAAKAEPVRPARPERTDQASYSLGRLVSG